MKNKIILTAVVLTAALTLSACKETDVVAKVASTSFDAILDTIPDNVASDDSNNAWALTSPTGERFLWSKDFSSEGISDAMIEFDSAPFVAAGLDLTKLPAEMVAGDKIVYVSTLGDDEFTYKGDATPLDSFNQIVKTHRDVIGYHEALDHYGISLGDGNMFEWAKDAKTNDKDIVFVLNPQPFIDAGVDPNAIEGWVFAKVPVMDENGKKIEVDKILKPFNLQ